MMKTIVFSIMLVASVANAQNVWKTDNSVKGYQIASVDNGKGSEAGVICNLSELSCSAYISSSTACDEGVKTPMMINSALGAYGISASCVTIGKIQLMVIAEFDEAVDAFQSGGEIGFAMPLASGQFRVVRFATAGATSAINAARKPPAGKRTPTTKRPDEIL